MKQINRFLWLGLALNGVMLIGYCLGWWLTSSALFLSQSVHYLGDVVLDGFMIWVANYLIHQTNDAFPYGFYRLETICILVVSIILLHMGTSILIHQYYPVPLILLPTWGLLPLFGVVAEVVLWVFWHCVSLKNQSVLLVTAKKHLFYDLMYSTGAMLIFTMHWYSHQLAAALFIIMGIYLCYQGIKLAWPAVLEVLDKGLSSVMIDRIASIVAQVPGVKSVHQIRSRSLSQMIVVELHIECDSKISISEGHYIAESVIIAIKHSLSHIMDVTVHVDPEADDAVDELPFVMPTRPEFIAIIQEHCHITVIDCELHYLTSGLEAIVTTLSNLPSDRTVTNLVNALPYLKSLSIMPKQ